MDTAIIDASSLISMAKINALSYFEHLPWQLVTVTEIYREVVVEGMAHAYPDALMVRPYFENQTIKIVDTVTGFPMVGISANDSSIIHTAQKYSHLVISNDQGLVSKCRQNFQNLRIQGTPGIILFLYKLKVISRAEAQQFFKLLVRLNRVSQANIQQYTKELEND